MTNEDTTVPRAYATRETSDLWAPVSMLCLAFWNSQKCLLGVNVLAQRVKPHLGMDPISNYSSVPSCSALIMLPVTVAGRTMPDGPGAWPPAPLVGGLDGVPIPNFSLAQPRTLWVMSPDVVGGEAVDGSALSIPFSLCLSLFKNIHNLVFFKKRNSCIQCLNLDSQSQKQ